MEDKIFISEDDYEINDADYSEDINQYFSNIPNVAKTLFSGAKKAFNQIENMLYKAPAFFNMIKASIPEHALQAVLTKEQKSQLTKGTIKLMTKKDGSLLAKLINPKTNKIIKNIPLKDITITPQLTEALTSFAMQMQLAQIAKDIQLVQVAIEEVRQGQEFDRLSTAYTCQQNLLNAMKITKPELKTNALLQIALDAERSRNLLMQSQNANLNFIKKQPESFFGKILNGDNPKKIDARMNEIRESLSAVNIVSLVEAMAYHELGEDEAAKQSLQYYANYLQNSYFSIEGLVQRLDSLDSSTYWSKTLPEIKQKIHTLPCVENNLLLEGDFYE